MVIRPTLRDAFQRGWAQSRVILFSAPFGLGKTTAARALLEGEAVSAFTAAEPDFLERPIPPGNSAILIDELHLLREAIGQQALCAWIRDNPARRFVLLGRSTIPGWLMPFQFSGLVTVIGVSELQFDRETVGRVLEENGITVSDGELTAIYRDTEGYPAAVTVLMRHLADGTPYSAEVREAMRRDLFHYIEDAVFLPFPMPLRRLLLALAPFETFDAELAQLVSGDSRVNELLAIILHETSMLAASAAVSYQFWPVFRDFLRWELSQACTPAEQNAVYSRAGLYYELHDDYPHALDCYARGGDSAKVSELLEKSADQHPGLGHYYDMEQYYYALPEEQIRRSVSLMSAMSMLTAMNMDYEASEKWYTALQEYAAGLKKGDAEYRRARGRLAYLDIGLPQRGSQGLAEVVGNVFQLMTDKQIKLPALSVTSTLPSVLNGGKDFCEWSRQDELLYKTMHKALEVVLGKDGVGLAECAICESQYEKGGDISQWMMALVGKLPEIRRRGTPDLLFAATAQLVRIQAAQGSAAAALAMLEDLRSTFAESGQARFLPNMDAMRCRLWLRLDMLEEAETWYREQAPAIGPRLRAMWRYRYMTRAMVEIQKEDYPAALVVLAMLQVYCQHCSRTLDNLHLTLLTALCHYRQGEERWRAELSAALDTAWDYGFVMPVAQYGAAVLPLLTGCGWQKDRAYFGRLLGETRKQAVHYPDFLRPQARLAEPLSPAEVQVLKLLCHDRSNQEIADILGVKVATVKTHVIHILQKLGVNRRGEAKTAAEKLHLI